jgi:4-hydroxy-3-polyprenylbenzoate decarboxylase
VVKDRLPLVVGVTGASGTPYARSLLLALLDGGHAVDLIVSRAARLTLLDETGVAWRDDGMALSAWLGRDCSQDDVTFWGPLDMAAGPSSGSYRTRGMVIVPATTGSCAGIALGLSKDLLQRAADVTLKERRRLVVVPRETPFARSTLVHLLALHDAGAVVLPASPGFYHGPTDLQELVDFVAGKILDLFEIEHDLFRRWEGRLGAAREARQAT